MIISLHALLYSFTMIIAQDDRFGPAKTLGLGAKLSQLGLRHRLSSAVLVHMVKAVVSVKSLFRLVYTLSIHFNIYKGTVEVFIFCWGEFNFATE